MFTLLDLDVAQYQGALQQVKNANDNLIKLEPTKDVLPASWSLPKWNSGDFPCTYRIISTRRKVKQVYLKP